MKLNPGQTIITALAALALFFLAFVLFGIYTEIKTGNRNYVRFQDSVTVRNNVANLARLHPRTREDWMRNSLDSAKFELDSLLIGDTATRELHRDKYYSHLSRVDSLLYNDPARGDDVPTEYSEHIDAIKAQGRK